MDLSCDKYGHVRSEVTDSCQAAKFTHCLVLCSSVKCGYILGSHVILNHTWNAVWLYCSHREKLGKNPLNEHVVIKGSNIHLNVLVKASMYMMAISTQETANLQHLSRNFDPVFFRIVSVSQSVASLGVCRFWDSHLVS